VTLLSSKLRRLALQSPIGTTDNVDYVNFLLAMMPMGIVAGHFEWSASDIFAITFLAIVPLAAVLSFATEELSIKLGKALDGPMNATFGNYVQLIVGEHA
jgi:Ca2+:H+ antiporter